ncbi:hypothetical protein [Breznakiella homolactica]|uniref:Uncharacterized protein n=1 Tax=Breznakiella homolactica TaxID=2798577 RepID=A0A7T7XJN9_9SPIR|nr:hypothetical protein [Breznakiella homolactica]QQO07664.1 hypothetical protein JFL75_11980 [Breznakiella homolactica]
MMGKNGFIIILRIFFLIAISFHCYARGNAEKYDNEIIRIDTTLRNAEDKSAEILLNTKAGCSETGFVIKEAFYDDKNAINSIFKINSLEELMSITERYFDLSAFNVNAFPDNFWNDYLLVFILQNHTVGTAFKNERIEQNNDKYFLVIEQWHKRDAPLAACLETVLYLLKIPK